jgi:hypothetical protein
VAIPDPSDPEATTRAPETGTPDAAYTIPEKPFPFEAGVMIVEI